MQIFDHSKLIGKIIEVCGTKSKFGLAMGWSHTTTSAKLNGNSSFTQSEIIKAAKILGIPADEISLYFFTLKV